MYRKVIEGTKDLKVVKGNRETRRMRCQRCKGVVRPVPNGRGGTTSRCQSCGATFGSRSI